MSTDILVLGSGPAGLAIAAESARLGLRVAVLSPDIDAPWAPTWGAWVDTLPAEVLPAVEASWPLVEVRTGAEVVQLERAYARFDSCALRTWSWDRALHAQVAMLRGSGRSVSHGPMGSIVTDQAGQEHRASLVIDATGRGSLLARRGAPAAFQTAWGITAEVEGWSGPPRWMDLSPIEGEDGPPTFLYALPMPDGRLFLEETSLFRAPPVPRADLERRLHLRLRGMGLRLRAIHGTEDCAIPMDTPIPSLSQRVVGFGAAAAMIHPATGYLLARALRTAPNVAAAIRDHLPDGPQAAARAAWRTIWPASAVRAHRLHVLGAQMLSGLNANDTRRFFAAFFSLSSSVRDPWLDGTSSPSGVALGMLGLFGRLPAPVRWRLVAAGLPLPSSTPSPSEAR